MKGKVAKTTMIITAVATVVITASAAIPKTTEGGWGEKHNKALMERGVLSAGGGWLCDVNEEEFEKMKESFLKEEEIASETVVEETPVNAAGLSEERIKNAVG